MEQDIVKELVGKVKLDQPNFEFDREALLSELNNVFQNYLEEYAEGRKSKGHYPYVYPEFKRAVAKTKEVFDGISKLRESATNLPLKEGLWKCFFARHVCHTRSILFPAIHAKIASTNNEKSFDKLWKAG